MTTRVNLSLIEARKRSEQQRAIEADLEARRLIKDRIEAYRIERDREIAGRVFSRVISEMSDDIVKIGATRTSARRAFHVNERPHPNDLGERPFVTTFIGTDRVVQHKGTNIRAWRMGSPKWGMA